MVTMFGADDFQLQALRSSGAINPALHGLPSVDMGSISPVALATLDSAVTGEALAVVMEAVLGQPLEVIDDGEQLLFAVRPQLTEALRAGGPELPERAGAAWAQTEEMRLDHWREDDCQRVVGALVDLARALPQQARLVTFLAV